MFGFGTQIGNGTNAGGYFNPVVVGFPVVSSADDPIVPGSTLECSTGTWIPLYEPIIFSYQWYRNGEILIGEQNTTYTTVLQGVYYCAVTATNSLNNSTTVKSNSINILSGFIVSELGIQLITEDGNLIITQ